MAHIKRIDEITTNVCNESKTNVEKNENEKPYYVIKRRYYNPKKGGYYWEDEDRTFNSINEAMDYIRVNAGQGMRYSEPVFKIFMETPVQMVTVEL